jgi:hypothetical protein
VFSACSNATAEVHLDKGGGMEAEEDIPEVEPEPKLDETALEPLLAFA